MTPVNHRAVFLATLEDFFAPLTGAIRGLVEGLRGRELEPLTLSPALRAELMAMTRAQRRAVIQYLQRVKD